MNFQQWLLSQSIDCQTLTTELEQSLRQQFDQEQRRLAPVSERLISPGDCLHPQRTYRVAVIVADAAAAGLVLTKASELKQ